MDQAAALVAALRTPKVQRDRWPLLTGYGLPFIVNAVSLAALETYGGHSMNFEVNQKYLLT